jgi:hypothetical protein
MTTRDHLRASFFRTLRRAFSTTDGREIAADALSGLLDWRPAVPATSAALPYDDIGSARHDAPPNYRGTVFITGRFRTGSTLVWNLFRHVDQAVSYYEPLNERKWFDPSTRGDRLDPTHRDVDDYWREYTTGANTTDCPIWPNGIVRTGPIARCSSVSRRGIRDCGATSIG